MIGAWLIMTIQPTKDCSGWHISGINKYKEQLGLDPAFYWCVDEICGPEFAAHPNATVAVVRAVELAKLKKAYWK